jgi:hypothetical protein
MTTTSCCCARNADGTVTTFLCPAHADTDPCLTTASVTGRRRKGTIRGGVWTRNGGDAMTRNWWLETIMQTWSDADYAWQADRERVALGYATENREYAELHPRPTLKETMVGLKGAGER